MTAKTPEPIRVRMAPSPTGPLHIGSARTTLFNWLYAHKTGGVFILRIEDTDKERSKKEFEEELLEGLSWLGIDWDEGPIIGSDGYKGDYGPYRQSERTAIYKKYLEKLLAAGDAYYCYCTKEDLEGQRQSMLEQGLPPKYNGHCRNLKAPPAGKSPQVIRFKIPEIKVEFKDLVRGKVTFDASLFGDQAIAKDLESPLYNFAVVIDDEEMKISHVIRGEEHLSNTPKQILMARALGFKEPAYAHIPLILNADRSKMSKRLGNAARVFDYRDAGYLPEAIDNFLALLGWHPQGHEEVMDKNEIARQFELERVQKAGAIFDQTKLDWLNREHMKKFTNAELAMLVMPFAVQKHPDIDPVFLERLVSVERTRANTLNDFTEVGGFLFKLPDYDAKLLIWKEAPLKDVAKILAEIKSELENIDDKKFIKENLTKHIASAIGDRNRGTVLWPLRVALSGQSASPDPIDIMNILGKERSLMRITIAIDKLGK